MRKIYSILGVAALSTLALVSCNKEAIDPAITSSEANKVTLTINAIQSTKTYIDGTDVKWATSGEKLKVFEEYTASGATEVTLTPVTSSEGTTDDSGATMTFAASFVEATADSYAYYAFYPSSAYNSKPTTVEKVAIEVKSTQTPTATSFDPSADILIAKPDTVTAQATSLNMEFARVVAVGKMTLTGLTSSAPVTQVTFSATDGDGNAVTLAGRTAYNLSDASIAGNNTKATSIVLNYSALSLSANESMDVWFTCLPFSLSGAGSFKVVVETASETFTKEVSLSESQNLKFIAGKASRFTVDMSSVSGSTKAVDLCYAELTYSDFTGGEGYASTGYNNVTVSKTHGDIWSMNATNISSSIGLKKTSSDDSSSYIKLPDFESNITSVLVTCSGYDASDSLALRTSADFSGNYIFGETERTLLTSGATSATYTFDLSSKSVKTAYLKAFNHQIKVTKVVVLAGTDTRTALDVPASVTAAVDAETVNTINVSWDAVSGAASYTVTLQADGSSDVVVTTTNTSYVFSDLAYETDYLITVVANPSDYYTNKDSDGAVPDDFVKTGAKPAGTVTYHYEALTTAPEDWTSGTYIVISGTSVLNTSKTSSWGGITTVTKESDGTIKSTSDIEKCEVAVSGDATNGYYLQFVNADTQYYISPLTSKSFSLATSKPSSAIDLAIGSITNHSSTGYNLRLNGTSGFRWYSSSTGTAAVLYVKVSEGSTSTTTPLSTPEIAADVQNDNEIYVTWDAVENAGSYIVTCTNQSDQTVTTTEATFTGLANGDYTVTVTAVPSDATTYSNSAAATATVTVSASSIESTTATINFGSADGSTSINATSVTGDDSAGNTWTVTTVTSSESFTQNASYSQVGASKKPATSITFTTTLAASATIDSFAIKLGGFSSTAGTVSLKVGDTEVGTGSLNGTSDVTVSSTKTATGTVLTATITSISKGVKVYNIEYKYH